MAKVNYILNRPSPGKLCSILVQLYISRQIRPVLATGEHCRPENWNGSRVVPAKSGDPTKAATAGINSHLAEIETNLLDVWRNNKNADRATITALAEEAIRGKKLEPDIQVILPEEDGQKKTSLFTVGRYLVQCKRELTGATVNRYSVVWRALSRFQNGKRLDFSAMDMTFYDRLKNFLYETPNQLYAQYHLEYDRKLDTYIVTPGADPKNPIGLMDDVVFKYIIILKQICEWAANRGYKVHTSYKIWPIISREYDPISWTTEEIEAIENLPRLGSIIKEIPHKNGKPSKVAIDLDFARDYIIFASRTGPRISDVKRFNPDDIKEDVWTVTQKKGNRTKNKVVKMPLRGFSIQAKLILKKYNYSFPSITENSLNFGIREVCKRAGITQPFFIERWAGSKKIRIPGERWEFFSSHSCKKTFITLLLSEGVPIAVVSELTGTSQRTIERHYAGKIEIKKLKDYLDEAGNGKTVMRKEA